MKINYVLNEKNEIISWQSFPYQPNLPHIEIPNNTEVYINYSQIVGGRFIQNKDKYLNAKAKGDRRQKKELEIARLKQYLTSTDYIIIKDYEGLMTSDKDREKAQEIKNKRAEAREQIRKLEHDIEYHNY